MIKRKRVAVIGAGVSGLAAARAFSKHGHLVQGFERSHDLGGVWEPSRSYPGVQTQSPKDLYCFTDHPMPDAYPEWPGGGQVHDYLHSYAKRHDLAQLFQLNTRVDAVRRRDDGLPGWTLTLDSNDNKRAEDFDFVAVCTGQFSDKNVLQHPGQERFEKSGGQVLHSSEYTRSDKVSGQHVVVLGGSKSATDIAVHAAGQGAASVTMVYLEKVWRVPYFVGGINFKRLLYMRAQEMQFNAWGRAPLARLIAAITRPLVWANFRGLETLLKFQLGLKRWNMVPDTPIEQAVSCALPIVTPGLFESFKSGAIRPVQGTFSEYGERSVTLNSGETLACDLAIQAVGWKLGVPYLDDNARRALVDDDGQYRVYRLAVNPDLPDMGFVGFNSSFCSVLSSELVANWLVRYADGQLNHQPDSQQMHQNIEQMLQWRRQERPAAQVYGGLCSAPFHFRHFDELLDDMGATKRQRSNPLAEYLSYPNAKAFGEFLASAPDYRAQ